MGNAPRSGLGFGDRVVLFVAWIVTCGVVYVFGFYVGKGSLGRRDGIEERVVRLPVTAAPPPAGQRPQASDDLTFYETLVSGNRAGEAVPPGPARTTTTLAPAAAVVPPAPSTAAPRPGLPPPATTPPTTVALAAVPSPEAALVTTTLPRVIVASATTLPRVVAVPPAGKGWTVEASPTRDRSEAEDLLYRLRSRGYDVKLVQIQRDGDVWYRLRVGRYPSPEQASETVRKLRDREGVAHVFVASE
jgi:cell division protein FtsN